MSKIQRAVERAKKTQANTGIKEDTIEHVPNAANQFALADSLRLDIGKMPFIDVSEAVLNENRILTHPGAPRHPVQGAYRMLRTRLMQILRSNNWRVLGVSSIGENEGKTFTAINLAISIAAEIDQQAVLVDLDLQRPSVHKYFGLDSSDIYSLREYLGDEHRDLADLFVCPGIDRFGLLMSAEPLARSSDVLASPRGVQLFAELIGLLPKDAIIIVDLPPLLATDDALAVAPMLDALLLVVAEGQAERHDVLDARQVLESFNVVGTVLNKSVEKDSRKSSYY